MSSDVSMRIPQSSYEQSQQSSLNSSGHVTLINPFSLDLGCLVFAFMPSLLSVFVFALAQSIVFKHYQLISTEGFISLQNALKNAACG